MRCLENECEREFGQIEDLLCTKHHGRHYSSGEQNKVLSLKELSF